MQIFFYCLIMCLWRLGGWDNPDAVIPRFNYRDNLIPQIMACVLGAKIALEVNNFWAGFWIFFWCCGSFQIIRLGYGEKSIARKIFKDPHMCRAFVQGLYPLVGFLPLLILKHINLSTYFNNALILAGCGFIASYISIGELPKTGKWRGVFNATELFIGYIFAQMVRL